MPNSTVRCSIGTDVAPKQRPHGRVGEIHQQPTRSPVSSVNQDGHLRRHLAPAPLDPHSAFGTRWTFVPQRVTRAGRAVR
jgi:hypothetical protein